MSTQPTEMPTQAEIHPRPTYTVEQVRDELRKFVPPFRWVLIERLIDTVRSSTSLEEQGE